MALAGTLGLAGFGTRLVRDKQVVRLTEAMAQAASGMDVEVR